MREALAKKAKANKTCPVSTGIFLRIAIEASLEEQIKKKKIKNQNFLFGELLTKNLLLQRKLSISKKLLKAYKNQEFINE